MITKREYIRENNNSWELYRATFGENTFAYKVLASCPFKGREDVELEQIVNKDIASSGKGYVSYIYKYALLENIVTGCYFVAVDVSDRRYDGDTCFFTNYDEAKAYFDDKVKEYCE